MLDKNELKLSDTIRSGNIDATRALIQARPQLLQGKYRGFFPWLTIAAQERSAPMVAFLIDYGLDVNEHEIDDDGESRNWPLVAAITQDHPGIVRLLLERGADPNVERAVIGAIVGPKRNSLEMVKLLHQHGADLHQTYVNEHTGEPMTALGEAINWGKKDVAEYLRSQGCQTASRK